MTVLSVRLAGSFKTTGRFRSSFSCLVWAGDLERGGDGDCSLGLGVGSGTGPALLSLRTGDLDLEGDGDWSLRRRGVGVGECSRDAPGGGDGSLDCVGGDPKTVESESLSV